MVLQDIVGRWQAFPPKHEKKTSLFRETSMLMHSDEESSGLLLGLGFFLLGHAFGLHGGD